MTTTEDPARAALVLAEADPGRAVTVAAELAACARERGDLAALSRAERAMGIAAVHLDDLATAARHLRAAIRTAGRAGSPELAAEARIRMAFVTSMRGRPRQALADLEALLPGLHGELRARADAQRAAVFNHLGRHADALAAYRQAVPVLRRAHDHVWLQRVLSNRGIVYGYRHEFAAAEADFHEAEELCAALGLDLSLAVVRLNLGWVRGVRGDVPGALRYLDLAESRFRDLGTHQLGWLLSDRSELLLSVGLTAEARAAAEEAVAELRRRRRAIVLPEVRLLLARAATLEGDHEHAVEAARRAAREFGAQQRPEWRSLAAFAVLRSRLAAGHPGVSAARFEAIAGELAGAGWTAASVEARLLGARVALRASAAPGARARALDLLTVAARFRQRGPALSRVRGWHAEALRRLTLGDRAGAAAAVRRGLRVLDEHRAALGATDLRAHSAEFRVELAELGLRMALDRGGPAQVLAWAEQGRASHLLMRRVRPPDDPWLAGRLAELRAVAAEARTSRDPSVTERQAALERRIRDHTRARSGETRAPDRARRAPGVVRSLAPLLGDRALVEFVLLDGVLHAVAVAGGRARLTTLGPVGPVRDLVERVPFALRRLARSGDARGGSSAAARMARHAAGRLDTLLLAPLGLGDRPLVVVPTGPLQGLPWPVLPSCAGRPVVVSPSAALWRAAAEEGHGPVRGPGGPVVVASGPGLPGAAAEVAEVAAVHGVTPSEGGAEETLAALDGARLAHLAAHGRVNAANPLFSALHLADGPLTVYDLERLRVPPRLVVLAACESGRSVVRAGDELLGLSTTFLALGTRCVVASMVPVPDARARPLMTALHGRLAAGQPAATALARTQQEAGDDVTAAGFVCIGADVNP